jgi:DNA-binding protein, stimulates sugar fermentation
LGIPVYSKVRVLKGRFLRRINRFVCEFEIKGEVLKAHLNNTGKLLDLLVEGREVLVTPINGNKLHFRIVGTKTDAEYFTLIDTDLQETAFLEAQRMGLIPFLEGFKLLKRNPRVDREIIDFLFWNGERFLFVELKSAVYYFPEDKSGRYPDTVTLRGRRQIEKLKNLNGFIVFVVGHPMAEKFKPSYDDPEIPKILKGLEGRIFAIKMGLRESGEIVLLDNNLKVDLD